MRDARRQSVAMLAGAVLALVLVALPGVVSPSLAYVEGHSAASVNVLVAADEADDEAGDQGDSDTDDAGGDAGDAGDADTDDAGDSDVDDADGDSDTDDAGGDAGDSDADDAGGDATTDGDAGDAGDSDGDASDAGDADPSASTLSGTGDGAVPVACLVALALVGAGLVMIGACAGSRRRRQGCSASDDSVA